MEEGGGDSYTIKVTYFDINLISEVVVGGRVPLLVKAGVDSDREKRPMNCRFQFVHIFPIGASLNLKLECVEYLKTLNFIFFCFVQTILYLKAFLCMFYFADFQVEFFFFKAILSFSHPSLRSKTSFPSELFISANSFI